MKLTALFLTFSLVFSSIATPAWARKKTPEIPKSSTNHIDGTATNSQMILGNIQTTVYSVKKTRKFVAVEIGFANNTNDYIEFTPKEIYLNSATKYSVQPLSKQEAITAVTTYKDSTRLIPLAVTLGLGIGALGASRGNSDVAFGLGMAALSVGAVYALSEGLRNNLEQNKLVAIENNPLNEIKRLPPGITLGGYLYFPAVKKPTTISIVAKSSRGGYETITFDLSKSKGTKKSKYSRK